ncbi:MAG TPA: hypothetical protein VN822_11235 [Candidatus Acidoferrales bacterium]|nr:hypothetical protein [Candidatus Acidoferrales bacterium]
MTQRTTVGETGARADALRPALYETSRESTLLKEIGDRPVEVQLVYAPDQAKRLAEAQARVQTKPRPKPKTKRRVRPARRVRPLISTDDPPEESHHARRCSICSHPARDVIEEAFLQWRNVSDIKYEFHLPSRTTVYSHAHATGLFERRRKNLRAALELIIEEADRVSPTADSIIRAVHALTKINDAGEWIESPAHVVVSSGSALFAPRPSPSALRSSDVSVGGSPIPQNLIGTQVETENDATR